MTRGRLVLRILICSEYAPLLPVNGARLVLRALLPQLQKRHDVRIVCIATADEAMRCDPQTTTPVVLEHPRWTLPLSVLRSTVTGRPLRVDDLAAAVRPPLADEIASFRPDVVHVMTGGLAGLGRNLGGWPSILAALDASHLNWEAQALAAGRLRRLLLLQEARRVRRFEHSEYKQFGRVVVVSESDRDSLANVGGGRLRIAVVPNGVDSDYFAADARRPDARTVAFHGVMDFAPNVTAARYLAERIWPRVLEQEPGARLLLIGRNPTADVRALGEDATITVTADVADVRPWLRQAAVYACPMVSGTGIKNKLLEAMALELACVASPRALGGLAVEPGKQLLVADGEAEFASAVVGLVRDAGRRESLGREARTYVRAAHSWEAAAKAYEAVYHEVIGEASLPNERPSLPRSAESAP